MKNIDDPHKQPPPVATEDTINAQANRTQHPPLSTGLYSGRSQTDEQHHENKCRQAFEAFLWLQSTLENCGWDTECSLALSAIRTKLKRKREDGPE